jgi:hypothetical protein
MRGLCHARSARRRVLARGALGLFALLALGAPRAAAQSTCTNTCGTAFDGECDDGGLGSEYDICALGTDCADCGARGGEADADLFAGCGGSEAEADEEVEVCENTCRFAYDGECDEDRGGPGATRPLCPLGSDCRDCGGPVALPRGELGGCRAGADGVSTALTLLLLLAFVHVRRRGALVGLMALLPAIAHAQDPAEGLVVSGAGWDVAAGAGAGAALGSARGGAHVGPRVRVSFHAAPSPVLLVGAGASAQGSLLLARLDEASDGLGGRGHLDLFLSGCALGFGPGGGLCLDAGGFAAVEAAHVFGPDGGAEVDVGAGPLLVYHARPVLDGVENRGARLELGWDLLRGLFELRLGFDL